MSFLGLIEHQHQTREIMSSKSSMENQLVFWRHSQEHG